MRRLTCWLLLPLLVGVGFAQQPLLRKPEPKPKGEREPAALERAQRFAQRGDWEGARSEFEKAVKANPNDVRARKGLTEVLLQLGKLNEALPHLRWLTKKEPHNPRIWSSLGQVLEQKGQLDEALQALRKAAHLRPEDNEFRVHLSRVLIALERWDEAAHHLRWVARRIPDLASVQYHLALYYERKGEFAKALHHARLTVQLSPNEPDARLLLARLSVQRSDFLTAAGQMEALAKQFPNDAGLALEAAKLFAQAGDENRAIRHFRRTLHLKPDNADAHRALSDLYSRQNEWAKALWHVRWLEKRFPSDKTILQAKAQCYARLGRPKEAEQALRRWVQLAPNDFEPFVHLARLALDQGDGAKARRNYEEALKRRPPVEVIAEAADLEMRLGEFEKAAGLYQWAQRRQPDKPLWRGLRAEALMRARKIDRAGRILRLALKRFPEDLRLNALMGLWHAKRVEWIEAEGFLRKGISQQSPVPYLEAVGALVEIWLCQGRTKEAVQLCEVLLQKRPSPEMLIWWAQAMDALGKTKEAAQRLERSQAFANGEGRIAQTAARLWELANKPAKAAAVWENFASYRKSPQSQIAALLQAERVWERANDIPKALAVLEEKTTRLAPGEPALQAERIRLMLKAQAFAAALEEATDLLTRHPDEPKAAALSAEAALGLWKEAAFERAAKRFLENSNLAGALMLVADRLNRMADAEKLLRGALQLKGADKKVIERWLSYGKGRGIREKGQDDWEKAQRAAEQGQIDQSLFLCRKVITQSPDFLPAYELLVGLYHRRNDLSHVIRAFTQMANRYRDSLPLNFAAATALTLDGQNRRAIPYWRRVCALTDDAPDAMLKLADSLKEARQEIQAGWVRRFVQRLKRWEGESDAPH